MNTPSSRSIHLMSTDRKKPIHTIRNAHGEGRWIVCLDALKYTDLVASGSSDGFIRFWKADAKLKILGSVASIPMKGYINSLKFSSSGRYLIVGVGQEHRLGRWERVATGVKNGIRIIPMPIQR